MATDTVTLSCAHLQSADLATVEELARFALCVRRRGCDVRLEDASDHLVAVIELAGLGDVLRVEVKREPEQRE